MTAAVQSHRPDTAVTIISVQEQYTGWYSAAVRSQRPDDMADVYRNWTEATESLSEFDIVTFSEPSIYRYEALVRLRLNIGRMDLRIAAIALEHSATVVTRNRRDFGRVPGLPIVDWSV